MRTKNLRCFPNPFMRLDHEGVPAATFPFDPSHSPDRRWVGAVIDRSADLDGLPRTRQLDTPGDVIAVLPRGQLKGRVLYVDRAPRKRVQFAFDLQEPAVVPPTSHYLLGFRQGSLLAADEATAAAAGCAFVSPAEALLRAAARAIAAWEREYGETPDVAYWPENLRAAAGLMAVQSEKAEAPASAGGGDA